MLPTPKPQTNCSLTSDSEFHPLRPYPGNPCQKDIPAKELTFACGQAFTPIGQVELDPVSGPACADNPSQICITKTSLNYQLTIDLSQATVPFLGNTENRSLTDAAKINQYLNYYLGGTVQSSDQIPIQPYSPKDIDRMVNYSGPVKKLLPLDLQTDIRESLVNHPQLNSSIRNYIVACANTDPIPYTQDIVAAISQVDGSSFTDNMELGGKLAALGIQNVGYALDAIVTHAIPLNTTAMVADFQSHVSDANAISRFNDIVFTYLVNSTKIVSSLVQAADQIKKASLAREVSCAAQGVFDQRFRLSDFDNTSQTLRDLIRFTTQNIPFGGQVGSFLLTLQEQMLAKTFHNIPFSSLEDTVGEITIGLNAAGNPHGPEDPQDITLTIRNPLSKPTNSKIYIPHVRNIDTLSQLLVSTFRSRGLPTPVLSTSNPELISQNLGSQPSALQPNQPAPPPLIPDPWVSQLCNISNLRLNEGDSVMGTTITADLSYTQTFRYDRQTGKGGGAVCSSDSECASNSCVFPPPRTGITTGFCSSPSPITKDTGTQVSVFSKIPLLGKIYDNLVVGDYSLLRRMFPQVPSVCTGSDPQCATATTKDSCSTLSVCTWAPIDNTLIKGTFEALPGYSTTNSSVSAGGDLASARVGKPAGIYFPLLGSLADYILGLPSTETYNLQKALRPQDFSRTAIISNPNATGSGSCSVTDLAPYFSSQASNASCICQAESGGNPAALNDNCLSNQTLDYSVGLFQINLLVHPIPGFYSTPQGTQLRKHLDDSGFVGKTCSDAFTFQSGGRSCTMLNQNLATACYNWFIIGANNASYASYYQRTIGKWGPSSGWSTAPLCGLQ
jgi:hypothetical protein